MTKGILGRKVGMTQIYDEAGLCIPVTVVQAGPCHVLQVRTKEHDGYEAVQLGFLDKPRRLASRWGSRFPSRQRRQALAARTKPCRGRARTNTGPGRFRQNTRSSLQDCRSSSRRDGRP